jgi:hypothetical protein
MEYRPLWEMIRSKPEMFQVSLLTRAWNEEPWLKKSQQFTEDDLSTFCLFFTGTSVELTEGQREAVCDAVSVYPGTLGPRLWASVQDTPLQRPFNALRCWSGCCLEALTHPERLVEFTKEIHRCRSDVAQTQADIQLIQKEMAKLSDQLHLVVTETQRLKERMERHYEMRHANNCAITERTFQESTIGNKRYADDDEMGGKLKRRRSSVNDVVDAATTLMGFANAVNGHLPRQIAI